LNTLNKLQIARGCSGSPLALIVTGKSLSREPPWAWNNRAKKLSKGQPILAFSADVLTCLQKSFDDLDPKVAECFRDLSLFPEAQRIPAAALVDIWAELRDEDDDSAMENIYELVKRNMADIVVTRYGKCFLKDDTLFFEFDWDALNQFKIRLMIITIND